MKLSDHCYCVTGLTHAELFSVNAGFVVGNGETIIIDAGYNSEGAQTIYHYALAVAPQNAITKVINLEEHYDHILGNGYFIENGVKIVAHEKVKVTEDELNKFLHDSNESIEYERRRKNNEGYIFHDGVRAFQPDIKITEDTSFRIDDLEIQIILAPGHTETNLMVHVEKDKVLYVGDTIYSRYLPTLAFGNRQLWSKWLEALDVMEKLNPDIVVPGHGEILMKDEIQNEINRHRRMLENCLK